MDRRPASLRGSGGEPDVVPPGGSPPTPASTDTPCLPFLRVFLSRLSLAFELSTVPDREFGR